jgi:hypothetical protein
LVNWSGLEINVEDVNIKKLLVDVDNLHAFVSGAQSGKEKVITLHVNIF